MLKTYEERGRLHDGGMDAMLDALYDAWQIDRAAGQSTLMIAANGGAVAELNQRARTDLIQAGRGRGRRCASTTGPPPVSVIWSSPAATSAT